MEVLGRLPMPCLSLRVLNTASTTARPWNARPKESAMWWGGGRGQIERADTKTLAGPDPTPPWLASALPMYASLVQ